MTDSASTTDVVKLSKLAAAGSVTIRRMEPWRRDLAARIDPALRYRVLGVQQRGSGIIRKLLAGEWEEHRQSLEQELGGLPVQRDPADHALYFSGVAFSCGVDDAGGEYKAHEAPLVVVHDPNGIGVKLKRIVGHLLLHVLVPVVRLSESWAGQKIGGGR